MKNIPIGSKFGCWKIIGYETRWMETGSERRNHALIQCDCGNQFYYVARNLKRRLDHPEFCDECTPKRMSRMNKMRKNIELLKKKIKLYENMEIQASPINDLRLAKVIEIEKELEGLNY